MDKEKPTTIEALAAMIQNTMASKEDLKNLATKDELKLLATKEDLKNLATKDDLEHVEKRLGDRITILSTKIDAKASVAETTDLLEEVHGLDKRVTVLERKQRS